MVICAPTDDAEGNRRVNWVLFKWVISSGIKGKSECVAVGVFVSDGSVCLCVISCKWCRYVDMYIFSCMFALLTILSFFLF